MHKRVALDSGSVNGYWNSPRGSIFASQLNMQIRNIFPASLILCGVIVIYAGCKPSIFDVVKVVGKVPLGASRDKVINVLVDAYGEKYPEKRNEYAPLMPAHVSSGLKQSMVNLYKLFKADNYAYVYPTNLFNNISSVEYADEIDLIAELEGEGIADFFILYDSKTNYIGLFAGPTR